MLGMRWVPVLVGGSFSLDMPRVPSAAGAFVAYSAEGGTLQANTVPTLDATATTLTAPAPAGSRTLTVASTAGMAAGRQYLVGGPEESGGEFVKVAKILGATSLGLVRAIRTSRASGDAVASTRVTFAIGAGAAAVPGRGYRIEWTWQSDGVQQDPVSIPFDVTRYSPVTFATAETVRTLDPLASKRVPDGTWLPDVLDNAWTMTLRRLGAKMPPGGIIGTIDLTIPHAYMALVLLLENSAGETESAALLERLENRFAQELNAAMVNLPTDQNQDGDAKTGEPGWAMRSISVVRG